MKMHLQASGTLNTVRSYSGSAVTVNDQVYRQSVVVLPDRVVTGQYPRSTRDLADIHLSPIVSLAPELVLIGTGCTPAQLPPERLRVLIEAHVGFEVMDTGAACRTFNILAAEGRRVAALLLLDPETQKSESIE
ncbi:MAG: Mth938-like domain-containing protein [Acidiferrobacteraceae bacterium]